MSGYDVVLFFHLLAVLAAFGLSGAMHSAEYQMAGADSVARLRQVITPLRFAPAFGPILLALVVLGMALTGGFDSAYSTSDPFAWTALIGAAALLLDGPLLLDPHAKKLKAALEQAPEGPVPADVKALAFTAQAWRLSHLNTMLALGVVFNMTVKPSAASCLGVLAVAALIGSGLGQVLCNRAVAKAG